MKIVKHKTPIKNQMKKLSVYLTKEGWKEDFDNTIFLPHLLDNIKEFWPIFKKEYQKNSIKNIIKIPYYVGWIFYVAGAKQHYKVPTHRQTNKLLNIIEHRKRKLEVMDRNLEEVMSYIGSRGDLN